MRVEEAEEVRVASASFGPDDLGKGALVGGAPARDFRECRDQRRPVPPGVTFAGSEAAE